MGRHALSIWMAGLACIAVCQLATGQDQKPAPTAQPAQAASAPRVDVSVREWDFGEAWQGQPLKRDIVIKNVGDAPLTLSVRTSCGCTAPTRPKSPLAPGESDTMTISYSSDTRLGKANHTVTVMTNDPTATSIPIRVLGNVKPLCEISPQDGLYFGQLFENAKEARTVEIKNRYTEPILLKLKEGQDFGPFTVELKEVEAGQRYALTAKTKPPLKVTRFMKNVVLLMGLELVPEVKTRVHVTVQPPVSVSPHKLLLPKKSVSTLRRFVKVTHAPDHPIKVTGVRPSHAAIKVEVGEMQPDRLRPGVSSCKIVVVLPPGDMIPDGAKPFLEIETTSKDSRYAKIILPIRVIKPRAGNGAGEGSGEGASGKGSAPRLRTGTSQPVGERE